MHARRGCSRVGRAYGIPRCASQYPGNGPSLCEVMCISFWDEEKGQGATSVDSLIHLGTFGGDGSCGVHQVPDKAFSVLQLPEAQLSIDL